MPIPRLLNALRDQLVTAGFVRNPNNAGALPPMWLEPPLGVPAPGEGNSPTQIGPTLVLGAFLTGGLAPGPYGSWHRQPIVDIRIRAIRDQAYLADDIEQQITKQLIDKRDWFMGAPGNQLYVVESEQWRALQSMGSDEQSHDYVVAYVFEVLRP